MGNFWYAARRYDEAVECWELSASIDDTFPTVWRNLALAYDALHEGGNMPCIVNAANEVVVDAFLHDRVSFLGMSDVIERTMQRVAFVATPTYDDYVSTDAEARRVAGELINQ